MTELSDPASSTIQSTQTQPLLDEEKPEYSSVFVFRTQKLRFKNSINIQNDGQKRNLMVMALGEAFNVNMLKSYFEERQRSVVEELDGVIHVTFSNSDIALPKNPQGSIFHSLHTVFSPKKGSSSSTSIPVSTDDTMKHVYFLKEGVLVGWNCSRALMNLILEETMGFVSRSLQQFEVFDLSYTIVSEDERKGWNNGCIGLIEDDFLSVSLALARLVLMVSLHGDAVKLLCDSRPIRRQIAHSGLLTNVSLHHISPFITQALDLRNRLVAARMDLNWPLMTPACFDQMDSGCIGLYNDTLEHMYHMDIARSVWDSHNSVSGLILELCDERNAINVRRQRVLLYVAIGVILSCSAFVFLSVYFYPKF